MNCRSTRSNFGIQTLALPNGNFGSVEVVEVGIIQVAEVPDFVYKYLIPKINTFPR